MDSFYFAVPPTVEVGTDVVSLPASPPGRLGSHSGATPHIKCCRGQHPFQCSGLILFVDLSCCTVVLHGLLQPS